MPGGRAPVPHFAEASARQAGGAGGGRGASARAAAPLAWPTMSDLAQGRRGRFVVLDGIDGCGKSTQARELVRWLEARGEQVVHLREPGSTVVGEGLREILLSRASELSPAVETLLFAAARRQMLDELVEPALARGEHVVCERFHASTFAYQAVAGGQDEERVLELLKTWAGAPAPDAVVLLDVDPDAAGERRGAPGDRIEDKGVEFQRRVAAGFERYAERGPDVVVVDGSGPVADVAQRVVREVERVL